MTSSARAPIAFPTDFDRPAGGWRDLQSCVWMLCIPTTYIEDTHLILTQNLQALEVRFRIVPIVYGPQRVMLRHAAHWACDLRGSWLRPGFPKDCMHHVESAGGEPGQGPRGNITQFLF